MTAARAIAARMKAARLSAPQRKAAALWLARLPEGERLDALDLWIARLGHLGADQTVTVRASDLPEGYASAQAFYVNPPAERRRARAVPVSSPPDSPGDDLQATAPAPRCSVRDPGRKSGRRAVPCPVPVDAEPEGRRAEAGIWGAPTSVLVPGPRGLRALPARYLLAPLASVVASHDERFRPSSGYPPQLQERDYARDSAEQAKIQAQILSWRPELVLGDDPTPASGPPILTPAWFVGGGNSRTIALKTVARQHPLAYAAALRRSLAAHPHAFGASLSRAADTIPDLDRWGLWRVLDDMQGMTPADLSRALNQVLTQTKTAAAEAASCGAVVPAPLLRDLAAALAQEGTSLADALAQVDAVPALRRAGMITAQNQAAWLRYRGGAYNNALSVQGAQQLARCLIGAAVGSVEALSDASPSAWSLLERIAPAQLALADLLPEAADDLRRAPQELIALEALPSGQRSQRYRQGALFGEATIQPLSPLATAYLSLLWRGRTAPARASSSLLQVMRAVPRPSPLTGERASADDLRRLLEERAGATSSTAALYALLDGAPMPAAPVSALPFAPAAPPPPRLAHGVMRKHYEKLRASSATPYVSAAALARRANLSPALWAEWFGAAVDGGKVRATGTNLAAVPEADRPYAVVHHGERCALVEVLP